MKISAPRGTKDVLPGESGRWQWLEDKLRDTAGLFGFKEIRFPTFEHTELFLRGVGETTDIVSKEMYTFTDKGDRSITLRPEGTASVVRAVVEHSLYAGVLPLKLYYIAPNFRYEKPQAGRLREHHQFGVELFGAESAAADAEVIALAHTVLRNVGVTDTRLLINSMGCPACRKTYNAALKTYLSDKKLCPLCLVRLDKNPARILDCKEESCRAFAKDAPGILSFLCGACAEHFDRVKQELSLCGIEYAIDERTVRGFDYYTRTVFEFVSGSLGAQATVCGGGRYDGLVEQLDGPRLPGIGFGMGLERLLLILEAQHGLPEITTGPALFLASVDDASARKCASLTYALRRLGVTVARDVTGRSVKAQLKLADKLHACYVCVIGEDELVSGRAAIRSMRKDAYENIPECPLDAEEIKRRLLSHE